MGAASLDARELLLDLRGGRLRRGEGAALLGSRSAERTEAAATARGGRHPEGHATWRHHRVLHTLRIVRGIARLAVEAEISRFSFGALLAEPAWTCGNRPTACAVAHPVAWSASERVDTGAVDRDHRVRGSRGRGVAMRSDRSGGRGSYHDDHGGIRKWYPQEAVHRRVLWSGRRRKRMCKRISRSSAAAAAGSGMRHGGDIAGKSKRTGTSIERSSPRGGCHHERSGHRPLRFCDARLAPAATLVLPLVLRVSIFRFAQVASRAHVQLWWPRRRRSSPFILNEASLAQVEVCARRALVPDAEDGRLLAVVAFYARVGNGSEGERHFLSV